jgi:hypothetical protein
MQFAIWREQDAMRQCGNGFGVIPRSFRDEKESFRLIAAASINCDFPAGLERFSREGLLSSEAPPRT